jgi:maltose O-acetyltransferase
MNRWSFPSWVIMAALRRAQRWQRIWYKLSFEINVTGTLRSVSVGQGLRLQSPVRVGGGAGSLRIGEKVMLGYAMAPRVGNGQILLEPRSAEAVIDIGDGTSLSNNVSIIAMNLIRVGKNCAIGDLVHIFDCDWHDTDPGRRNTGVGRVEPVTIGNNVWLGSRVLVLRGVTIGDNSVVGAGSVVTKSIPANAVAAGVPAKVLRRI